MLRETGLARQSIASRDGVAGLDHIQKAIILANNAADLARSQGKPMLVTYAREIETETTYSPVKKSKTGEISADRMKKRTNIRDVSADGREDSIDVAQARNQLEVARAALQNGDAATAERSLAAVESSVVHSAINGSMPLERAKENLALARARVQEGKYSSAAAPLRSAAQALEGLPGPHATDADVLRRQMDDFSKRVSSERASALPLIDEWTARIAQWER